jgi:aryl-alcohol dehydrogenase-like predicted oxidoreductase
MTVKIIEKEKKRAFELAAKMGVDSQNIAGAWPIHLKFPSFALIGPRTIDELVSSLKNLEVELSDEQVNWLNLKG